MVRFFDKLNTLRTVAFVLAFFLFVDGFLFYRYQQQIEGNDATRIIIDAESVAAEEALAAVEKAPDTPEEPAAHAEAQEPAVEEEITVLAEPSPPPTEEEKEGAEAEAVHLIVSVTGAPSWLKVQEDRQIVLDQESRPGFSREFVADRAISVQVGNAGAVRVEVDGRDLGPLGADGEVATRTYTAQKGSEASE